MMTFVEMKKNNGPKKTVSAVSQVMMEKVASADGVIHIGAEKARWERAKTGASSANDELLARLLLDLYFYWFASRIELKNIGVIRPMPQKRLDEIDEDDDEDVALNLDEDEGKGNKHRKKNETVAFKVENVKIERTSTEGDGISNFLLSDALMNVEKERSNIKSLTPPTLFESNIKSLGSTLVESLGPKLLGNVVPHLDHVKKKLDGEELDGEELGSEELCMDVSCLEEREAHEEDDHSMLIVAKKDDGRWDEQLGKEAPLPKAGQTHHGKNCKSSQQKNPKRKKRVKKQHRAFAEKDAEAGLQKIIGKRSTPWVENDRKKRTVGGINSDYVDENPGSEAGIKNMREEEEQGKNELKIKRGRGRPKKLRENIMKVLKVRGHPTKRVCEEYRPMAEDAEARRKRCYEHFNVLDGDKKAICCLCRLPVNFHMLTLANHLKHDHGLIWKDNCLQALSCDDPGCAESIFHTHRAYLLHKKIVHKQLANSEGPKREKKLKICSICGQLYQSLKEHMKSIHNPEVTCPEPGCGRLVKEHLLRRHMMIHSSGVCPYPDCNTKFNSKLSVENHIRTAHRYKDKLQCPHCHMTLRRDFLKRHIEEMHESGITYPCPEPGCGQVFKRQRNCNQHAKLHLKIKPFQCVWCDFTGTQHNNVRSHALTKHRENFSKLEPKLGEKYWRHTDSVSLQNSNDPPEPS